MPSLEKVGQVKERGKEVKERRVLHEQLHQLNSAMRDISVNLEILYIE